jgi:hypothetical protein
MPIDVSSSLGLNASIASPWPTMQCAIDLDHNPSFVEDIGHCSQNCPSLMIYFSTSGSSSLVVDGLTPYGQDVWSFRVDLEDNGWTSCVG